VFQLAAGWVHYKKRRARRRAIAMQRGYYDKGGEYGEDDYYGGQYYDYNYNYNTEYVEPSQPPAKIGRLVERDVVKSTPGVGAADNVYDALGAEKQPYDFYDTLYHQ